MRFSVNTSPLLYAADARAYRYLFATLVSTVLVLANDTYTVRHPAGIDVSLTATGGLLKSILRC